MSGLGICGDRNNVDKSEATPGALAWEPLLGRRGVCGTVSRWVPGARLDAAGRSALRSVVRGEATRPDVRLASLPLKRPGTMEVISEILGSRQGNSNLGHSCTTKDHMRKKKSATIWDLRPTSAQLDPATHVAMFHTADKGDT